MFSNNSEQEVKKKLIILHTLAEFNVPLTNTQTTEFILEQDLMNYFELQQYLNDLVNTSMLEYSESEGDFYYLITENGKNSVEFFADRLSKSIRRKINDAIESKKKAIVTFTSIDADYEKLDDNEYVVHLTVEENQVKLIDMKLNMISNKHAKMVCDNWKKNAQFLYGDILALLTKDPEE